VKAKRVLLESMKDHLIPHIVEKETAKDMYDALVGLYQNKNTGRMLHLKHQLQIVRMTSEDTIVSYLMKITQIQDQLTTIGETVQDVELVNVALRGLPRSWEPFVQGICARDKFPDFDRLWTDCIQEETQLVSRDDMDGVVKSSSDENQALAAHTRKGRRGSPDRRGPSGRRDSPEREASPEPRWKKDLSKIRCFECHDFGHYASQCPHWRGEEEEGSKHQQQRLMRLQIGSRGRSCWSPPFQVLSPVGRDGWWIAEHLSI
jgi:hypothetical protein